MREKPLRERKAHSSSLAKDVKDPNGAPSVSVRSAVAHGEPGKVLSKTLTWLEIPDWQKDNEYILTGYRRATASWRACAASIFGYLHNETVNIHSHLGGAVLFLVLLATFPAVYFVHYESTTWADATVFSIFLSGAVFCLFSSAFYHTFSMHSEAVAGRCNALDYAGIVVLTVGSFFPCIYYGFFCEPHYQALYLSGITAAGFVAAYIVLNPEYRKPTHRGARTKVFIFLGLSGILPVMHGLVTHGFYTLCYEMGFGWLLVAGALYISGALLYANRVPERFSPGTFDYFFASHQIFHFFVVAAAFATYAGILTAFHHTHRRLVGCPAR
ncbi:HlyIII-domain-containing protein [Trametes coccinea BRFM310]|uniref:HlyIII-domain-containing protein n=1 Tax=Trametes coccinea (strain BRFM310) TaxID=1353009 RepID=A0A1Y2IK01_TRAC3|nr:HlyIII-domain-containing protein [Trametes coccinea BRFM310]